MKDTSNKLTIHRNGGAPQKGNLNEHLKALRQQINELIPDPKNNGLAIIDFESWRPVYRQNFGTLQPYRDLSEKIERTQHPYMSKESIKAEATRSFEKAGRSYVEDSLAAARKLRPHAKWGYYGLPYCFGRGTEPEECSPEVQKENDK